MSISSEQIKVLCRKLGADLCGISPVERFAKAPLRISPQGHLPTAKSVIVAAVHTPDSAWELGGEPIHNWGPANCVSAVNSRLERIGMSVAKELEKEGFLSVPIPQTAIWRYRKFKELDITFSPDLSHIHAAAAAGLGEIGFNGMLLTPEFGARQRMITIITEAELDHDPLYSGPPLCDKCMKCVKHCSPASGLRKEVDGITKVDIGGKIFEYANKNKFRCGWAERFQLSYQTDIPDTIDEDAILTRLPDQREGYSSALEPCWRYCVPRHSRGQSDTRKTPVRKSMWMEREFSGAETKDGLTPVSRILTLEVEKIIFEKGLDILGITTAEKVRNTPAQENLYSLTMLPMPFNESWGSLSMNPNDFLPEATNVISFGISFSDVCRMVPEPELKAGKKSYHLAPTIGSVDENDSSKPKPLVESAMRLKIMDTILDVSRHLEEKGYAVIGLSYLPDNYAAEACGIGKVSDHGKLISEAYGERQFVSTMITNAPLLSIAGKPKVRPVVGKADLSKAELSQKIKSMALANDADLVGIASAEQFRAFKQQLKNGFDEAALGLAVFDKNRRMGGKAVDPIIEQRKNVIKDPWDYLDDAKSVIVIGTSWPEGIMRRVEQPPAEAVGPHSMFAHHCTWLMLNHLALDIIRLLDGYRFKAVPTDDLCGTASRVAHTFGEVIDLRANAFAAIASGLAEPGWCGYPITEKFGRRQRFYAIVTDAELDCDEPRVNGGLCKKCKKCSSSCPVQAISETGITLRLGNTEWTQGRIDSLRCDWAKRYGLVGDEGPKYMGSQTNIIPPNRIDGAVIAEAMGKMDPLQKRIPCIVERCMVECKA